MKRFNLLQCATIILGLSATGLIMACGGGGGAGGVVKADPSKPGYQVDKKPVTLDWYVNFDWFNFTFGPDAVSQEIVKETGVTINYIKPAGNPAEKLNTMIASKELPDLLTLGWWEPQIAQMAEAKLVTPLNKLAEQYDPYFFKVANAERLKWYADAKGDTYGYPNASYSPSDLASIKNISANATFLVRKDMWEAIGKPDMRTPEGFLKALRDAKTKFPKVNGQPLVPLGTHEFTGSGNTSFMNMLPDFLAIPYEKDGKFYDRLSDPEYKRWLKVFNKAYTEGLITDDPFVDKRAQMEEKITQGRYFAMLYQRTDFLRPQAELFKKDPNSIYIAVDGPADTKLDPPTLAGPGINGWTLTLVSAKSKYPDRAIRLMTYLMSPEGQRTIYLGVKGVTWDVIDGKEQLLPEIRKMITSDRATFDSKYGGLFSHWMLMDNAYALPKWEAAPESPQKELIEWGYGKTIATSVYDSTNPPAGSKEDREGNLISIAIGKALPKLLRAKTDAEFEKTWSDLEAEKAKQGMADVLAYRTQRMNENKAKLK